MTYISVFARMRAALATKCDTCVAIMSVSCTRGSLVFEKFCSSVPSTTKMNFQYDAISEHVRRKFPRTRSRYICGGELIFPNLNAFAQISIKSSNAKLRVLNFCLMSMISFDLSFSLVLVSYKLFS